MTARRLDGRGLAQETNDATRAMVQAHLEQAGRPPRLDVVLVGGHGPSQVYVRRKEEAAESVGVQANVHRLPAGTGLDVVVDLLDAARRDDRVDGVLVQLPLPAPLDARAVYPHVPPEKDVDGLHPGTQGRVLCGYEDGHVPATPRAIVWIMEGAGIDVRGLETVIVSHSNLIGRPLAAMLLNRDATVTVCHKHTRDLAAHTRRADLLVTAAGVPGLITQKHVRPGATVVDAATVRTEAGTITGDCTIGVQDVAGAVTPVPGGVGPVTVAALLRNTVESWRRRTL